MDLLKFISPPNDFEILIFLSHSIPLKIRKTKQNLGLRRTPGFRLQGADVLCFLFSKEEE